MSLLPNDLASGSTAVIPMLTEAGPTQPYFAPASGGGGGGGGSGNFSTVTLSSLVFAENTNQGNGIININALLNIFDSGGTTHEYNFAVQDNLANISQTLDANSTCNTLYIAPGGFAPGLALSISDDTEAYIANVKQAVGAGNLNLLGPVFVSTLNVSSINGAQPGGAIPEDLTLNSLSTVGLAVSGIAKCSTIQVSSIGLQGFQVPLFQNGRFTMPNASSNVVETDVIFSGTDWGAWACYDGAVDSAVSSIGTQVLSRSTFALYAQGGLGVSWQVLGN